MSELFPGPADDCSGLHLTEALEASIQHEVLFEKQLTRVRDRPLFLGLAYGKGRFIAAFIMLAGVIGTLVARAAWMQLVQAQAYQRLASMNRLRETPVWPKRGLIFDRHGQILAENVPRFEVTVIPHDLPPDPETQLAVFGRVARVLGLSVGAIQDVLSATSANDRERLLIADQIDYARAMNFAVNEPSLAGFHLEVRPKREYPFSSDTPSLSHVLGYVGRMAEQEYAERQAAGYERADEIGKAGVERTYETALRGRTGKNTSEVDALGHVQAFVGAEPAQDGQNLTLSLDVRLQQAAEQALRDEMAAAHLSRGSVVAMDPRDGSILALVSWPAFDDNEFANGVSSTRYQSLIHDPDQPLFPRAWAGTYPSGSTVKILISVAALAEHVITPQTTVLSSGGLRVGPWFFPDWKAGGHGLTNVRKAISLSVNTFFYTIGGGYRSFVGLGVERLTSWMQRFGLGAKTGLDLPGEAAGFVPSKAWKEATKATRWFVGDTYNLSIGQGDLLVTPVQVARYTSAIANGGFLVQPHVLATEASSTPPLRVGAASDVEIVREGMHDNATIGTGRALSGLPFSSGGKTGTAQWRSDRPTHAWFTAFAPYEQPEITVTVMLEEGGEGSSVCVPVAKRVLQAWWNEKKRPI